MTTTAGMTIRRGDAGETTTGVGRSHDDAPPASRQPRWRRVLWPTICVVALVAGIFAVASTSAPTSDRAFAPDNPGPGGAMATAEILSAQGVRIRTVYRIDDALRLAEEGTTLLVAGATPLEPEMLKAIGETRADVVLAGTRYLAGLDRLTDRVTTSTASRPTSIQAQCGDPHAQEAFRISHASDGVSSTHDDVEICFPLGDGAGAYASWEADGRRMYVVADFSVAANEHLASLGNAALVLRTLGQHETLVWYLPTPGDELGTGEDSRAMMLPPQARYVLVYLLVVVLVVMLWRGRRLGPVVTEQLPVVVRAAETTRGRGSLYRRSGDVAHAGAALRAGVTRRMARSLGLPRSAGAAAVVPAVARATGRPEQAVHDLLYGAPPASGAALASLTRELDTLESEVHRP